MFTATLIATNTPIIAEQPKTQTVTENASALLTVLADGAKPFTYQWRFNGADLTAETNAMLARTNMTADQDGFYSVVVSNWTGVATSEVARLFVRPSESPPVLESFRLSASNRIEVTLNGERGRFYRIETSTNLVNWSQEKVFPSGSYVIESDDPLFTSVFFNESGSTLLSLPAMDSQKYVRASRYVPQNEICNLHLKQFRFARILYVREHGKVLGFRPDSPTLAPYFPAYSADQVACPDGGVYRISFGGEGNTPTCTVPGHILEEPPE
jgi:hypothetical protein